MKERQITNLHDSVRQKLYSVAKKRNEDYNAILRRYFQERFLYRVSVSKYAGNFILKGAQLIIAHHLDAARTTKDIDFLGFNFSAGRSGLTTAMQEIASLEYPDGTDFLLDTERTEDILERNTYKGIRFHLICRLGSVKSNIQIDIGFGDVISPRPEILNYPVILPFDPPRLFVYTIDSAIAEKIETIASLGEATSRIKDYFDLYFLATSKSFSARTLQKAVELTFKNRQRQTSDAVYVLEPEFAQSPILEKMWQSYLIKNKDVKQISFKDAHKIISGFLKPILNRQDDPGQSTWTPVTRKWES